MSITVRFFASVRERLGKAEVVLNAAGVRDVADVWARATGEPRPARLLAAVNLEHAGFDRPVRDGDEVAFFPPVTGGQTTFTTENTEDTEAKEDNEKRPL